MKKNKEKTNEEKQAEIIARETWDSWILDLEEQEQPACDIENQEDCENCGS
jgi:hypothetical protein